jgi:hypothetical protein
MCTNAIKRATSKTGPTDNNLQALNNKGSCKTGQQQGLPNNKGRVLQVCQVNKNKT